MSSATATEGWAALEAPGAEEPIPADLTIRYRRTFGTPEGAKVLADLYGRTIGKATEPGIPEPELRHLEGQRALVRYIMNRLDEGRKP